MLESTLESIERRCRVAHGDPPRWAAVVRACDLAGVDRGRRVATGWPAVDAALGGGLPARGLHEWFGPAAAEVIGAPGRNPGALGGEHLLTRSVVPLLCEQCDTGKGSLRRPLLTQQWHTGGGERRADWAAPLCALVHMAWRFVESGPVGLWTVWVGGACAPYPPLLARAEGRDRRLLERSLFVSARDAAARLWAVDVSLRCPAVGLVVADGRRFDRAASRRVHLVARNHGKWALIARPAEERGEISAAHSRWMVRRAPSGGDDAADGAGPRWTVQLLRCKGVQAEAVGRKWTLEWDHVHGALCISSALADSAGAAAARSDVARAAAAGNRSA